MQNDLFNQAFSSINDNEFALFRDYLRKISGILIPPEKAYLFETRLTKMMVDAGIESFGEFYEYILSGADPKAPQKIINAMVTNETLWFRDEAPWKVLSERVLPKLVWALQTGQRQRVRFWFSAVSTGQEAYSTIMCVDEYLKANRVQGVSLDDFDFVGTDISTRVLDIARMARYDAISIRRGLSDAHRAKYFTKNNTAWILDPRIKDAAHFAPFNLRDSYGALGSFDVIFCRYVLIYFPRELQEEVVAKMRASLTDGGVLFTGNYALLDLFEEGFDSGHYKNSTYYTKKAGKQ